MNTLVTSPSWELTLRRHRALSGLLELILRHCELPPELAAKAQQHYAEKTAQLKACTWLRQFPLTLKPQGSAAYGTTVAPLRRKFGEFDVDLLLALEVADSLVGSAELHRRVGERLRLEFARVLSAIRLGWTLDYAERDRFHFDVIPVVQWRHPSGLMMRAATDWKSAKWQATNPEAFVERFLKAGELLPYIDDPDYRALNDGVRALANSAREPRVDPLPENTLLKSPLQRMTQLTKRYRDVWSSRRGILDRRTPSIVVTTLIWRAYERHITNGSVFPTVFSVLHKLAEKLDDPAVLIVTAKPDGKKHYTLFNPTVPDENLVRRWNEPGRESEAGEFYAWTADFRKFLVQLEQAEGRNQLDPLLLENLGAESVTPVLRNVAAAMRPSRDRLSLGFSPSFGIATAATAGAVSLRGHTYHGIP
jgi:hypothetical protein